MKIYLVRWRYDQHWYYRDGLGLSRQAAGRVVKAFTNKAEADQYCEAMQRGRAIAPGGANPFFGFLGLRPGHYLEGRDEEFHGLQELTTFPEAIFCDWILDCGLAPPEPITVLGNDRWNRGGTRTYRDWYGWWEENVPKMDDSQRCKVWQALDRLTFFEVVETKLET